MNKILALLKSLKVFDSDNTLSHTSLLLTVAISRLALFPADTYTIAILTLALAHANAKKFSAHKRAAADASERAAVASAAQDFEKIKEEIKSLNSAFSLKNLGR